MWFHFVSVRFHPLEEVSEGLQLLPGRARQGMFPSLRGSFGSIAPSFDLALL